jgi:hypothetical protein
MREEINNPRVEANTFTLMKHALTGMRILTAVAPLFLLILVVLLPLNTARADESNKLTIFTFSAPVELPGVTLPAGTYTFKLMDSAGDRNVVQVFNKDMTKLYATILAIADYRQEPSEKTIIRFSETSTGAPSAIKEWFYPGDNFGQEFVYPKSRAKELAKASNRGVPSMPDELKAELTKSAKSTSEPSVTAMKDAQLKAQQPNGSEVEISQSFETKASPGSNANIKHHVNTEAASNK